ncbi:MAG: hypothetical protein AAGA08_09410 [Pseudomonadota bacterium]
MDKPLREGGWGDPRKRERHLTFLPFFIIVATLTPTAAFSEVCDKVRPDWVSGTQTTAWQEAIHLFSTLPSLFLIIASMIVVLKRSQRGGLAVVLLWSIFVSVITFLGDPQMDNFAIAQGCMGSPTLFIGAVTAICVAIILYTLPRETRL